MQTSQLHKNRPSILSQKSVDFQSEQDISILWKAKYLWKANIIKSNLVCLSCCVIAKKNYNNNISNKYLIASTGLLGFASTI